MKYLAFFIADQYSSLSYTTQASDK